MNYSVRQPISRIYLGMGATKISSFNPCADRRTDYDVAFHRWAQEVKSLQSRASDDAATQASIERARSQSERAESEYRESRNRLWQCLDHGPAARAASC